MSSKPTTFGSPCPPGAIATPIWDKSLDDTRRRWRAWPPEAHALYGRQLEAMLSGRGASGASGDGMGSKAGVDPKEQLEQAYAVLGVESSASDGEVKKAYRRQMSQNHPDKLASKGMPESMREMAEEKTREIGAAYERICEARGIN